MSKKIKIFIILLFIIICAVGFLIIYDDNVELRSIKSESELSKIYEGEKNSSFKEAVLNVMGMPFSALENGLSRRGSGLLTDDVIANNSGISSKRAISSSLEAADSLTGAQESTNVKSSSKDYSTTNIQVENVDEADITKTDGDYIYSISENNVIITNVMNPKEIKIEATITSDSSSVPDEMILYKDKLVVIYAKSNSSTSYSYYGYNNNTIVKIYDIKTKAKPKLVKSYELYQPYYTSRCINNKLYVISSGALRKENNKIVREYKEDNVEKEIKLKDIKYLKDVEKYTETIISVADLDNTKVDINVGKYLIDISNAYVSENAIYLLNQRYDYNNDVPPISSLFGWKGVIGVFTDYDNYDYSSTYKTKIYKFEILNNGQVSYKTKTEIDGKTINQYSLDEKNEHLRVALYDNDGARVAIFDKNLNKIGISNYVAKGETMYSSRFMGDKAYLVTYKTMDPLFVIDLSNEAKPKVLGELSIPGYSTYLHPYDENHLIGIGMETKESVNRNSSGRVISTTARIVGMKMALFDVTDVSNPIQISQTVIGDSRTTSAILTNPKALLFSKEKELIAIPVNNYSDDFEIASSGDTYSSVIDSYTSYSKPYVAEGYFVYKINIKDGFKLKGIIKHEASNKNKTSYNYYYYNRTKLLRGLYIDDNLYTVSETAVKVNDLKTLDLVSELKIKEEE